MTTMKDAEEEIVGERNSTEEGAVMADSEDQQVELPLECVVKYKAVPSIESFTTICVVKKIIVKAKKNFLNV